MVIISLLYVFLVAALAFKVPLASLAGKELALAVDGLAVKRAGKISKGGNPMFAVLLSWGFSVFLILIGGFHFLLHLLMFFVLFITVVLIAGVIILRSRQPDADRPYRAWGHPWSTYTCLFVCILLALFEAVAQINTAAYAAIFVAISWPVYRYLVRSRSNYKIRP